MQAENLRKGGVLKSFTDATEFSDEYRHLERNVKIRHTAYQNYLSKACNKHVDYSSNEPSAAFNQCIESTLAKLAPAIVTAEDHYDKLHAQRYNVRLFKYVLEDWQKAGDEFERKRDNQRYRFGSNSFFDKYSAFAPQ